MNLKSYIRIGDKFLYTDIINCDNKFIRLGTIPKISKLLKKYKIYPEYIILLPPTTTQAGDNYTGEEFILWNKIYNNDFTPNTYIGEKKYVNYLYNRLKYTVNQKFNKQKTKIIIKNRIKKLFKKVFIKPDSIYRPNNNIEIHYNVSNVKIFYKGNLIYDWHKNNPPCNINYEINKMLLPYKKKIRNSNDSLNIIPLGFGNGFNGDTSNFIIQYSNRNIWVDVMAEPFLALKKIKLHFNHITDFFISHIHEDHIEGFSAVLKRASIENTKINLITTYKIFKQLKKIYTFLFPYFLNLVNHINIVPNFTLPYYQGYLKVRLTHHPLKSGTLALKVQYKNNVFALSGDTYYSEKFEKKYSKNTATDSSWYNDCQLLFHEVEFFKKNTVHTYYTDIKKLSRKINAKILVYHNSSDKFLLPGVKKYKKYIIKNGKVIIK